MPQTRPRIVPTIAQTGTGTSIVDDILARAGSTPLVPSSTGNVPLDSNALIQQLLAPPAPPNPPTILDKIGMVLNAVGQGVAVGTSNDPGQALQQQFNQRAAIQQAERDRQMQREQLNKQFGFKLLENQLAEELQIKQEQRQEEREIRKTERENKEFTRRFNLELTGKKDLMNIDNNQQYNLAFIKNEWDKEKLTNDQAFQTEMYDRQVKDKRLFNQVDTALGLIRYGIDAGRATAIAKKWMNDEALTKEESSAINYAVTKANKATRSGGSGGSSLVGGVLSEKQKLQYLNTRLKDSFVVIESPDGQGEMTVEMSNAPRDETGEIVGFKRVATLADKQKHLTDETDLLEFLSKKKTPTPTTTKQTVQSGGEQTVYVNAIVGMVDNLKKQGLTDEAAFNEVIKASDKTPQTMIYIQAAAKQMGLVKEKKKTGTAEKIVNFLMPAAPYGARYKE